MASGAAATRSGAAARVMRMTTDPLTQTAYEDIIVDRPGEHIARVTIARPDVANALRRQTVSEIGDAVRAIDADDDIRVWILTGAPRHDGRGWFSAGVDMKEAITTKEPGLLPGDELCELIDDLLKPSIAVIDGVCTTGGLELILACDLRIAADTARISDFHMERSGLAIGGWGAAVRLSRLVGVDKAKEILLMSQELSGEEAARIGLVNRVAPQADLEREALAAAARIAQMPRRGVRTTLGFLQLQRDMSKHDALRWGEMAPGFMGLQLRPFKDAADRFYKERGGQ